MTEVQRRLLIELANRFRVSLAGIHAEAIGDALAAVRQDALEDALRCHPKPEEAFKYYDVLQGKIWVAGVRAKWQGIADLLAAPPLDHEP